MCRSYICNMSPESTSFRTIYPVGDFPVTRETRLRPAQLQMVPEIWVVMPLDGESSRLCYPTIFVNFVPFRGHLFPVLDQTPGKNLNDNRSFRSLRQCDAWSFRNLKTEIDDYRKCI